jgi:hypothetical protein
MERLSLLAHPDWREVLDHLGHTLVVVRLVCRFSICLA